MASQAFISRLSTTCCIWTRSASTGRQRGIELQRGHHVARDEFAVSELERFAHHVVELDRRVLRVALAEQRAQPLDDLRGAFVVLHDVLQDFAELGRYSAVLPFCSMLSAASALPRMDVSGCLSSCAKAPDSWPSTAARDRCVSCWRWLRASASARLRAVTSVRVMTAPPSARRRRSKRHFEPARVAFTGFAAFELAAILRAV